MYSTPRRRLSVRRQVLALSLIASLLWAIIPLPRSASFFPTAKAAAVATGSTTIVISQVYGGGGNSGATYKNDFIELHNVSSSTVDISAWSVQYNSATSTTTTWQVTNLCSATTANTCTLAPGQYYLVQEAAGTGGTVDLPTPDAIGTIALAAGAGKVALVNNRTALTTSCPKTDPGVIDFVGYGTANCFEGSAAALAPSATLADIRKNSGCLDTDNNSTDFATGTPTPRNKRTPATSCKADGTVFDTAPFVTSTTPASGATNVAVDANISVTFSEAVNATANSFTISCASSGAHTATISGGATTYTLNPDTDFANSETCTVTALAAQITDQDTNDPPDTMTVDYQFSFTTAALNLAVTPNCPGTLRTSQGTAASTAVSATDSDGTVISAAIVGTPPSGITLDNFTPASSTGGTATATLNVSSSVAAGTYNVVIRFSNDDSPTPQTADCTVAVTVSSIVLIHDIQGSSETPNFVGSTVAIRGIVVGDFQGSAGLSGFFVEEEQGDQDADPATSEGIFVFDGSAPAVNVNAGDQVTVLGTVSNSFSLTQLTSPTVTVNSTDNALPAPVTISLPVSTSPAADLERYEGMYVAFSQTLFVTDNLNLGKFGELTISGNNRLYIPTNSIDPNDNPASGTTTTGSTNVAAVTAQATANNNDRIILDDASSRTNNSTTLPLNPIPYLGPSGTLGTTVRIGDTINSATGILSYDFGSYLLEPTTPVTITPTNPRPAAPDSVGTTNLRIGSFNVENYFLTYTGTSSDRGANNDAEHTRQRDKLIAALAGLNADVIGLYELQKASGPNGVQAADDLAAGLTAFTNQNYAAVANPAAIGTDPDIKSGIIYRTANVTAVGGSFTDTAAPAGAYSRDPLAQTFTLNSNNEKFTVIANHLKAKACSSSSAPEDKDQNDGQGCFNDRRRKQAQFLTAFINTITPTSPRVITIGDFNAHTEEDPIDTLRAAGLIDLISRYVPAASRYSFTFSGEEGLLDHAFGTSALNAQTTGATVWHINADEPDILGYDGTDSPDGKPDDRYQSNAYRSSDHDPLLIGLNLAATPTPSTPDLQDASDTGASNSDNITSDNTPTFDIAGVTSGALVELLRDGAVVASGTASGTSISLSDATAPADGTYSYTARQTSGGGGTGTQSTALSITIDTAAPTAAINQADNQADPTASSPINFTVVFSESVSNFTTGDVTLSGTAEATTATVTGEGTTYNIAVSGMTQSGTVIATIAAGVATDAAGNTNTASTSTDNMVTYNAPMSPVFTNSTPPNGTVGTPYTFTFTASGTPPPTFSVTSNTPPPGLTLAANGTLSGTPTTAGNFTFTVTASNGVAPDATQTVTIKITGAPVAANDAYTTSEDTALNVAAPGVLANDTDAADNQLTAVKVSDPAHGTVTLNSNGSFTYTPAAGFSGADSFTYKANNGTFDSNTATVNINVTAIPTPTPTPSPSPTPVPDTTAPSVTINQAAGQADPTNTSPINFTVVFSEAVTGFDSADVTFSGAGATTATVTGSGTIYNVAISGMTSNGIVTASVNASGATDAAGNTNTASTSTDNMVTYNAPMSPVFTNGAPPNGTVGTAYTFTFTASGTPSPTFSVTAGTAPAGLSIAANGTLSGTPTTAGTFTFTVTASNGVAPDATQTVTIKITGAPVANNDTYTVNENSTLNVAAPGVLANDTDAAGNSLTAVKVSDPAHGSVTLNSNGSFTYTPAAGFSGADSFTYKANNGTFDSNTATVNINVAGGGTIQFSVAAYNTREQDGTAIITVTRTGGASGAATVRYATSDGTATAGADYTAASGTISFADGDQQSKTFTVPIINDTVNEPTETLNLTLSNVTGSATLGTPSTATLMILDDDAAPTLAINDVSQTEGNTGTTAFTFTVMLSGSTSQTVTVNYATADGTATAGSDYTTTSGTLTFAPGETSKQITVQVAGDTQNEPDETFFVNLTNAVNATVSRAQGTGTISNDDAVFVQFNQAAYAISENDGSILITVTRTGDTSQAASIDYATNDVTAKQKSDYTIALGTLQFAAGQTTKTFSLLVNPDSYIEGAETLTITLSNPVNASLGGQTTAVVTIAEATTDATRNSIDDARNFVYQQYHDFLNREPDAGGIAYWTNEITKCGNDAACITRRRTEVAAAFFIEKEYQDTGFAAYRLYKATFGRAPTYLEYTRARSQFVAGQSLTMSKQLLAEELMKSDDARALYGNKTNTQYVDATFANTSVVPPSAEREALIGSLESGSLTRSGALVKVADTQEFVDREFNAAFVTMQYFGYLRRDADEGGFQFWLDILNNRQPNNYRGMVCAFVNSREYQERFSTIVTRTDRDCAAFK
ncbi:MAG: ExeM/NucH family extracellular endonuclease [Pyrinomonadaceae bacterium]